ncbi:MAG: hypothetical protein V1724_03240 [Chloroflexota bacterium]
MANKQLRGWFKVSAPLVIALLATMGVALAVSATAADYTALQLPARGWQAGGGTRSAATHQLT